MKLVDLNVDCLLEIFSYLSENDLINLCRANSHLNNVIDHTIFYEQTLDLLMCGHRHRPAIMERTQSQLSFANRLKIARNWLKGCYRDLRYFERSNMFPTKLHLERNWLYFSHDCYLRKHKRIQAEPLQRSYHRELDTGNRENIADFVKKYDTIFAGDATGFCVIVEDDYVISTQQLHNPKAYIRCVDFAGSMYATSTDFCAKLWRRETGLFQWVYLNMVKELKESYKTMRFNVSGDRLFGGLFNSTSKCALREIDLESGYEHVLNSKTISIYDLKLKDEHQLLTANFDTSFRLYDRRSNRDELIWGDPFNLPFYCLEYDGLYAVLCGAKYHRRVTLYDLRMLNKYIQLYIPHAQRRPQADFNYSPVYSLACDSRYLFVATDRTVHVLDFKVDC